MIVALYAVALWITAVLLWCMAVTVALRTLTYSDVALKPTLRRCGKVALHNASKINPITYYIFASNRS